MQNGRIQNVVAWWVIAAIALIDAVWIGLTDFQIAASGAHNQIVGLVGLSGIVWYYGVWRGEERIAVTLAGVMQLILFTVVAAPFSYLCASLGGPFWDTTLQAWDRALGLDWLSYLAWVNERPLIGLVFTIAYSSLLIQMVVVCVVLGFTGRMLHLSSFLLATVVSGVLCILISAAMPAVAMYVHFGLKPDDFPNLSPGAAYVHIADVENLRNGTLRVLNVSAMQGIITFPSYHAALGLILSAALWTIPLLRWPGVTLNLVLIAATPIDGGHYFVDVGAGLVIAALSLAAARNLGRASALQPKGTVGAQPSAQMPAV
jgi:hypothetical protein